MRQPHGKVHIISDLFRIEESTNVFTFTCTLQYNFTATPQFWLYSLCKNKVTFGCRDTGTSSGGEREYKPPVCLSW